MHIQYPTWHSLANELLNVYFKVCYQNNPCDRKFLDHIGSQNLWGLLLMESLLPLSGVCEVSFSFPSDLPLSPVDTSQAALRQGYCLILAWEAASQLSPPTQNLACCSYFINDPLSDTICCCVLFSSLLLQNAVNSASENLLCISSLEVQKTHSCFSFFVPHHQPRQHR